MITVEKLNCNVMPYYLTIDVNMDSEDKRREFGKWFSGERIKTGLKSKFLADKADIDPVQLSRIENGHSSPKRQTIIDLVEAANKHSQTDYKIDVNDALLRGGFSADNVITDDDGLFRDLKKLAPRNQRIAKQQISSILKVLSESEQDFDYGDFDSEDKSDDDNSGTASQYVTGVPYKQ